MALNAAKAAGATGPRAEPLEPENYMARVVRVLDLGVQEQRPYKGKEKPPVQEIMVTYELGTEFLLDDDGNPDPSKPRWLSERMPLYNLGADKAKSTKRYLALDPAKKHGGDWTALLGAPCLVAVVNNERDGRVYDNIGGVTQPLKGVPVPELVNEAGFFDYDDPDMDLYNDLPEWVQKILQEAVNYRHSALAEALGEGTPEGETSTTEAVTSPDDDFPV